MKHLCLSFLLLFFFIKGYSQNYMEKIAEKSCDCVKALTDTIDSEQLTMKLGLCMIDASTPYKKQIKKDYNIDLDNIAEEGEKLGKIIGLKMATVCPDALIKITQMVKDQKETKNDGHKKEGIITRIENDCFVIFSLKDEQGKIAKFYWLEFIDSEIEMTSKYNSYIDKSVKITYDVRDFFDPKIMEYRQYYIIRRIELME